MTHEDYAIDLFARAGSAPTIEWQITMLFYAAVHAANHFLFNGVDVAWDFDHKRRALEIDKNKTLRPNLGKYRALESLAHTARYKPFLHPMTQAQVDSAKKLAATILKACGIRV